MTEKNPNLKKGRKWRIAEAAMRERLERQVPDAADLELHIEWAADTALTAPGKGDCTLVRTR